MSSFFDFSTVTEVRTFLEIERDVNRMINGMTLLRKACEQGNAELVEFLLEKGSQPTFSPPFSQFSPLIIALKSGEVEVVKKFNNYVNLNYYKDPVTGQTPLHYAVENEHLELALHLMYQQADITIMDNYGQTPLDIAISKGNSELIESILLFSKRFPNFRVEFPLFQSIDNPELVKVFLSHGCNVNSPNSLGETPLHWACMAGKLKIAKILILAGADINVKTQSGFTPLHYSLLHSNPEVTNLLLTLGCVYEPMMNESNELSSIYLQRFDSYREEHPDVRDGTELQTLFMTD